MADKRQYQNRVKGLVYLNPSEIMDHPNNIKAHPQSQVAAMRGVMEELGIGDTLLVYRSPRAGGAWVAVNGHMRKQYFGDQEWPCIEVDYTDEEADLAMQIHDGIGELAIRDKTRLRKLKESVEFKDTTLRMLTDRMAQDDEGTAAKLKGSEQKAVVPNPVPDMELRPYEHYDSILLLCRSIQTFNWLVDRLRLKKVSGTNDTRYKGKIGLERAVPADRLVELLKRYDELEGLVRVYEERLGVKREGEPAAPANGAAKAPAGPASGMTDEEFKAARRKVV